MPTVTMQIPPQAEHVRTARLVAGAAARRCGVSEDVLDEVRLAVGEATARAVLRHHAAGLLTEVKLELTDEPGSFTVQVHDSSAAEAQADDELALAVISAIAPKSAVDTIPAGTTVKMAWPVAAPAPA